MALLELESVDALYGRVRALRGITLSVDQGEVVALIGSNGAGKTTTLRTISGLMHPPSGSIKFGGKDISRMAAHDIVGLGICQSPEGRRLFPRMQVIDNLRMGAFLRKDATGIQKDMERVFELLPPLLRAVRLFYQASAVGTLLPTHLGGDLLRGGDFDADGEETIRDKG